MLVNEATRTVETTTERWLYNCKTCKRPVARDYRVEVTRYTTRDFRGFPRTSQTRRYWFAEYGKYGCSGLMPAVHCSQCGRTLYGKPVKGTYNPEHVCNSACMGAHGPNCDCQCAGANHGGAFLGN